MEYFDKYVSNTLAGTSNQTFFVNEVPDEECVCRIFYKPYVAGRFNYSLLFSNTLDSSFPPTDTRADTLLESWEILYLKLGVSKECSPEGFEEPFGFVEMEFDGSRSKKVASGELFCSDPVLFEIKSGEYICVEIKYRGKQMPCHEEAIIPSFILKDGKWEASPIHPFPSMIGCDRGVKARMCFLGDSITQGIGVPKNSYEHWNCVVADNIGEDYAYWNLGIGFGHGDDAAKDGAWLYKAKQNDIAVVCFGVNDINKGFSADKIKSDLKTIVEKLCERGIKVVLQTIPPFNYDEGQTNTWRSVNNYIKSDLSKKVALVFDCAAYLSDEEMPQNAKFGGHPNSQGSKIWGDNLSQALAKIL